MGLEALKPGDRVVKIIAIGSSELASISTVAAVDHKRNLISTDTEHVRTPEDIESDGVQTYLLPDGRAVVNYIPGCSSRLVAFDGSD